MVATQHFSGPLTQTGRLWYVAVPTDAAVSLGSPGHAPAAGTANGVGIHCVVSLDGSGGFRILLNAESRERLGVNGGEEVEFALTRDPTQSAPPMPDDLIEALASIDGTRGRWDALGPGHQRELLIWLAEAKGTMNRARRLARTVARVWE